MKIGASSCLAGFNCTYKAGNNRIDILSELFKEKKIVIACPEMLGGLSVPRAPAEIISIDPLLVKDNEGKDVTEAYINGAKRALDIFKKANVEVAILKHRSPSCGNDGIYDGTFSHQLIEGQGVFASMLERENIKVFNESQLEEFLEYIKEDL